MNKYNNQITQNKVNMLMKLQELKLQGNQLSKHLTLSSTHDDVLFEYQLQQYLDNISHQPLNSIQCTGSVVFQKNQSAPLNK